MSLRDEERFWRELLSLKPCKWICSDCRDGQCTSSWEVYEKCDARKYQVKSGWIEDVFNNSKE